MEAILYLIQFIIWGKICVSTYLYYTEATVNHIRSKYWFIASSMIMYGLLGRCVHFYLDTYSIPHTEILAQTIDMSFALALIMSLQVFTLWTNRIVEILMIMMSLFLLIICSTNSALLGVFYCVMYIEILVLVITNKKFCSKSKRLFVIGYSFMVIRALVVLLTAHSIDPSDVLFVSILNIISGVSLYFGISGAINANAY